MEDRVLGKLEGWLRAAPPFSVYEQRGLEPQLRRIHVFSRESGSLALTDRGRIVIASMLFLVLIGILGCCWHQYCEQNYIEQPKPRVFKPVPVPKDMVKAKAPLPVGTKIYALDAVGHAAFMGTLDKSGRVKDKTGFLLPGTAYDFYVKRKK